MLRATDPATESRKQLILVTQWADLCLTGFSTVTYTQADVAVHVSFPPRGLTRVRRWSRGDMRGG